MKLAIPDEHFLYQKSEVFFRAKIQAIVIIIDFVSHFVFGAVFIFIVN